VLKPGQFLAVRYRKAGKLNEVQSLSLIVLPTTAATGRNVPVVVRPGAGGTGSRE